MSLFTRLLKAITPRPRNWFKDMERGGDKKTLICICQEDTFRWPSHLGEKIEGVCGKCGRPIYYEKQNGRFANKICNRCAF